MLSHSPLLARFAASGFPGTKPYRETALIEQLHLVNAWIHFFRIYGVWTVFLATMAEGAGIPVPGQTLLLFTGFMARRGDIRLAWAVPAAIAGSVMGECAGYLIGSVGGKVFFDAYRKRTFVSSQIYERAKGLFLKNAAVAIVIGRFIAGVREMLGLIAGVFRMNFSSFLFYNAAGAVLWSASMCGVGYFAGGNWRVLSRASARIDIAALVAVAIVLVLLGAYQWRRNRTGQSASSSSAGPD